MNLVVKHLVANLRLTVLIIKPNPHIALLNPHLS